MKLLYCSFITFSLTIVSSSYLLIYCQLSNTIYSLTLNEHPEGQCRDETWIILFSQLRLLDYHKGNFHHDVERMELYFNLEMTQLHYSGSLQGTNVVQGQTEGNRGQNEWLWKL